MRVAELNRVAKAMLETRVGEVWVEGEVSDFTRSAPGHLYFTLNDETEPAQLRCVMFRSDAMRAKAKLGPGARVRLRGKPTVYEQRGTYQLVVQAALPQGEGELAAKLEALKKKLDAEGLFALDRKRALPRFPRVIGVVTSTTGAAMHDILRVASERSAVRIVVADCRVQGTDAPPSICDALAAIQRVPEIEVVIVGRGGGSAEDLVAFQDERVVRAIAGCRVPVVSAVGHETDVTLSDLVADVRAATPSNAAELVVPDARLLERELESWTRRLERAMEGVLDGERLRLERLQRSLGDPRQLLGASRRRVEELRARLERTLPRVLARRRNALTVLERRLGEFDPRRQLVDRRGRLVALERRLARAVEQRIDAERRALVRADASLHEQRDALTSHAREQLARLAGKLDALSPLAVLTRGYAIVTAPSGKAVVRASELREGDRVTLRFAHGTATATTESVTPEAGEPIP